MKSKHYDWMQIDKDTFQYMGWPSAKLKAFYCTESHMFMFVSEDGCDGNIGFGMSAEHVQYMLDSARNLEAWLKDHPDGFAPFLSEFQPSDRTLKDEGAEDAPAMNREA